MKKLLSVVFSAFLAVSVFSGCSKQDTAQIENIKITVDSHYSDYDESIVSAYEKLCNAVLNGEGEVKFNTALFEDVNQLYYTGFPLYPLVESVVISDDGSGCVITYKNDKDTHLELVSKFNEKISEIMRECGFGNVSINRYIFNVYTYITSNFTVDDTIFTVYDALVQGKGYDSAVNSLFEYLILQGGGNASHIIAISGANIMSLAEFNGVWYYFNPSKEIINNGGTALKYFAMNEKSTGSSFSYTDGEEVKEEGDDEYQALRASVSFNADGDEVAVQYGGSDDYMLKFN